MNCIVRLLALAAAGAGTLLAASADPRPRPIQPPALWLKLEKKSDSLAAAKRAVSGLGSVVKKDAKRNAYFVRLNDGLSYTNVLPHLRKVSGVSSVEADPSAVVQRGFKKGSVSSVDLFIESLKKLNPDGDLEEQGVDFLEAYRLYHHERAYPNDRIDWGIYRNAIAHRESMPLGRVGEATRGLDPNATWQFVGPKNLDIPYTQYYGVPPLSGRVNAIAYHPTNSNIVYIAGAQGGVAKTTDGGVTWTHLGDKWESLFVASIAIDKNNPNTIYVGGGDFHGFGGYAFGIKKTTDGGATWSNLPLGTGSQIPVSDILIDPDNSNIVTVTTGGSPSWWGGVYRSTNGGTSWTKVVTTANAVFTSLDVSKADNLGNRVYYAAAGGHAGSQGNYADRIWRSTDRGVTWARLNAPYPQMGQNEFSYASLVAASKVNPNVVYWLVPYQAIIYRSTNKGDSWTDVTNDYPNGGNWYNWSQYYYNYSLETAAVTINGITRDAIYCGNIDIAFSTNDGANWNSIGGPTYTSSAVIHNDQHSLAVNPQNSNQVMVGCDGGLWRFNMNAAGTGGSSTPLNNLLGITQFYTGDWHPTNPSVMLGGTQDNAGPTSTGDLNNWINTGAGDGAGVAINYNDPNTQFSSAQGNTFYLTRDGWASSSYISPNWGSDRVPFIGKLWMDPNNPAIVYAGTNYLWRFTTDATGTGSWTARLGSYDLSAGTNGTVSAVAAAPGDSSRIYVGTDVGHLWMSTNNGGSWTDIRTSPIPGDRTVKAISVNPSNKADILVALGGQGISHLWRCTNTNASPRVWTNVSGSGASGLPDVIANTIARDPWQTGTWYVGTDLGVFMTTNSGADWSNITDNLGLPNVQVNELKAVPGTGYLNAATFGRGMWRIKIKDASVSDTLITGVRLNPTTINAGDTSTGTVTVSPAPTSPFTVNLSATTGATLTENSIVIPAGQTSGDFTIKGNTNLQAARDVTVTASATAPVSSATAVLRVNATKRATFVSQTVPDSVSPGQTFQVSLTFKNTGSVRWTKANGFALGSVNPDGNTTWGTDTAALEDADSIAYNQSKTFTFNVTAPATAGTYNFQWRMKDDGVYFGNSSTNKAIIVGVGDNADPVGMSFPNTVGTGQLVRVALRITNTGTTTWQYLEHLLASQNPKDNRTWGIARIHLNSGESIAPGQEKLFQWWVTAPSTPGTYNFQWQMLNRSTNQVFGTPTTNRSIVVTDTPPLDAEFVSQQVPSSAARGTRFNVSITMKNTGTTSWTKGTYFRLGAWNPRDNTTWGLRRVALADGETIAPGASKTFTFSAKAPAAAGTYNFQWHMLQENKAWFGDPSQNVAITVP